MMLKTVERIVALLNDDTYRVYSAKKLRDELAGMSYATQDVNYDIWLAEAPESYSLGGVIALYLAVEHPVVDDNVEEMTPLLRSLVGMLEYAGVECYLNEGEYGITCDNDPTEAVYWAYAHGTSADDDLTWDTLLAAGLMTDAEREERRREVGAAHIEGASSYPGEQVGPSPAV